ncbi:MAG: GntR family transcriptional regulator [Gordonia sp. (in: high G+C Gram-positive bacteria)]
MTTSPPSTPTGTVYERLLSDIVSGDLISGEILAENRLAARYGTSRTPIREALLCLERERLVERRGRGFRVRTGHAGDILEIYEIRTELEGLAARNAAWHHTELEIARLLHIHEETRTTEDPDVQRRLNSQWHRALWEAGHNAALTDMLNALSYQLRVISREHPLVHDVALDIEEHAAVLEAVQSRDGEAANRAAVRHLDRNRRDRISQFAHWKLPAQTYHDR